MSKRNIVICVLVIIVSLSLCLCCEILKWGFKIKEIKQRQRFEIYKIIENELKEQKKYKISSLYRCPIKNTEICYKIIKIAEKYKVSGQAMIDLMWCESRMRNINGVIDSRDRGWWQINSFWHPEVSDKCAYDLICSTNWTASKIKEGRGWEWRCWFNNK